MVSIVSDSVINHNMGRTKLLRSYMSSTYMFQECRCYMWSVFEVRFDHLFASNVLKECGTVTKDGEVFVPLQVCRRQHQQFCLTAGSVNCYRLVALSSNACWSVLKWMIGQFLFCLSNTCAVKSICGGLRCLNAIDHQSMFSETIWVPFWCYWCATHDFCVT